MKLLKMMSVNALLFLLAVPLAAQTRGHSRALGDWHGKLQTPAGNLTLIVSISEGSDGLTAVLESPDQAPGRQIPITTVAASGDSLTFTIQSIAASYAGRWDAAGERWSGVWRQGGEMPLDLAPGRPESRPVIEGMDGRWEGAIQRNDATLRLILMVETGEEGTVVRLDSPDMMAYNIPVSQFNKSGKDVRFQVPAAQVSFTGMLLDNGTRLRGDWVRPNEQAVEVVFTRTSEDASPAERRRPQHPAPPFPYAAENVTFDNAAAQDVRLAGTLTLPPGQGPFPAAILISGSGPQDRDETLLGHKPFGVLADYLTRAGIAVLRYDDRGVGESSGDHGASTSADFATDANAAFRYLLTRSEIDPTSIGFIGHSEGAMVAPIAAAQNDAVAYIVSLAGPGTNTLQLLRSQRRLIGTSQGVSQDDLDRTQPVLDGLMAQVQRATTMEEVRARVDSALTSDVLAALGVSEMQRPVMVQQLTSPWLHYFLRYDPRDYYSKLDIPILAINGSLDQQVPADENLAALRAILAHNRDVTIQKLDGLNHLFQTARTGSVGEYADIEETFAPAAMQLVREWILTRFGMQIG